LQAYAGINQAIRGTLRDDIIWDTRPDGPTEPSIEVNAGGKVTPGRIAALDQHNLPGPPPTLDACFLIDGLVCAIEMLGKRCMTR
jgi:hypothetical protein